MLKKSKTGEATIFSESELRQEARSFFMRGSIGDSKLRAFHMLVALESKQSRRL
jgi:hypothetical protein